MNHTNKGSEDRKAVNAPLHSPRASLTWVELPLIHLIPQARGKPIK